MASEVRRHPHETPGYKVFQEHYDTLAVGIQDPAELAGKLFSKKLITTGILSKVMNQMVDKRSRCRELIAAIGSKIASDPDSFHSFISVLEDEPTLHSIALSMRKSLETYEGLQENTSESNEIHNVKHGTVKPLSTAIKGEPTTQYYELAVVIHSFTFSMYFVMKYTMLSCSVLHPIDLG